MKYLALALAAASSLAAHAADSINLGNYTVTGSYALDVLNGTSGGISGLEASAVAYAADRGTLFFVGDEGTGVVEISRTGQTLGSMSFDWTGTGSTKHDTEGLTYLGGGVLVVTEERLYDAYRFNYVAGGTARLADSFVSISNANVGNNGLEGISYDPRGGGSYVTIKQDLPQDILVGTLTFAAGAGGTATMASPFAASSLGLTTLSDVQTLSPVTALAGTAAADNLLVLSLGSNKLVEVTRAGELKSSFDLAGVAPGNAIEGVTVDDQGVIFLVAEQDGSPDSHSRLIVMSAPVPEPESYAMMLAGLGLLAVAARRKQRRRTPAATWAQK